MKAVPQNTLMQRTVPFILHESRSQFDWKVRVPFLKRSVTEHHCTKPVMDILQSIRTDTCS